MTKPTGRPKGRTRTDPVPRFWSYVRKTRACWLWTGSIWRSGYGRMWVGDHPKQIPAHVFSYRLHYGRSPKLQVLHTCDVRHCVNPEHLWEGTQQQNQNDMSAKRRSTWGEKSVVAKLTRKQALVAKTSSVPARVLAERWGVIPGTIWHIRAGRTWKWLADEVH
jgi:hypothetical protein